MEVEIRGPLEEVVSCNTCRLTSMQSLISEDFGERQVKLRDGKIILGIKLINEIG